MASENQKAITELVSSISKIYGSNSIMSADKRPNCFKVPTKNPAFDYVSTGGIPLHQIIEFVGHFSSTKTLHTYLAMAAFQRIDWNSMIIDGIKDVVFEVNRKTKMFEATTVIPANRRIKNPEYKYSAFIDMEGTYNRDFATSHGVWQEGVIYSQPDDIAKAVEIAELFLRNPDISLVVFDSMSAVSDPDEAQKEMHEHTMASNAKFWNKAMRKLRGAMNSNPNRIVTLILINSKYSKVGFVMGNPEVTRNGEQVQLAKSLSMEFSALKQIKGTEGALKEETIGRNITIRNLKNKFGEPFRSATFYLSFVNEDNKEAGKPYSVGFIVELALKKGIALRKGAWYEYDTIRSQGQDNFITDLLNTGVYEQLRKQVYALF